MRIEDLKISERVWRVDLDQRTKALGVACSKPSCPCAMGPAASNLIENGAFIYAPCKLMIVVESRPLISTGVRRVVVVSQKLAGSDRRQLSLVQSSSSSRPIPSTGTPRGLWDPRVAINVEDMV